MSTHRCLFAMLFALLSSMLMAATAASADPPRVPRAEPAALGLDASSWDAIDDLVREGIDQGKLPGAVVMIGYRGHIVLHRAYGHRQLTPQPLPMQLETVFDLASLTKPIATATSVMKLVEQGVVNLDDPVAEHLPEFGVEGKQQVTITELLTHTGGLIPDNSLADYRDGAELARQRLLGLGLNYPPGTKFRYSDVGFQVLGELIEAKTGKDVARYAAEAIFTPLGMHQTGYLPGQALRQRAAATQQRDGRWMVGQVHDPRAHLVGGIAGHAGLFSTADDLAVYAQMMLGRGTYHDVTILEPSTVELMTADQEVPKGIRGLGWDKRSGYSSNRGQSMTEAAFGHGGFTGTAIWIDPGLELFVIFLSNRVHPDGQGRVNPLAGQIGTVAADAVLAAQAGAENDTADAADAADADRPAVRCGIDVLVAQQFEPLAGRRVGLITNHTGIDRQGVPNRVLMHDSEAVELVALLSPEHGIAGALDQPRIDDTVDEATGLKVFSLYGKDRKPSARALEGIDTLVFDIQDIGCRYYTYISTMGEAMRVAADAGIRFVVLDRPNPIGGVELAGPLLDAGRESFVGYHTIPLRHGMTVGEIAGLLRAELPLDLDLQVIRCQGWQRGDYWERTGLLWVNPSPNMRTLNQAVLYPGVGLLETTNVSVGRGTDTPFELIGAPWMDAVAVAAAPLVRQLAGVAIIPTRFTPESSKFAGQQCQGLQILVIDRQQVEPVRIGLALALSLRRLHAEQWETDNFNRLLGNRQIFDGVLDGRPLDELMANCQQDIESFLPRRQPHLLY